MKFKIAFTLLMIMLVSMLSFSNRCGQTCSGNMVSVAAPSLSPIADADAMQNAAADEESSSPLLRMAITL